MNKTNAERNSRSFSFLIAPILLFCGFIPSMLLAQDEGEEAGLLEEIIITAQKREQTMADVPIAVSAITGDSINEYLGGAQDVRALAARVPGLNIETSNGRTQPRFYLRGMGNIDFDVNANQPVAMIFDDISLENNTVRSQPMFDIERIEVLKGPQGSLFGRNTNAGVIKIDSVKPSEFNTAVVTAITPAPASSKACPITVTVRASMYSGWTRAVLVGWISRALYPPHFLPGRGRSSKARVSCNW